MRKSLAFTLPLMIVAFVLTACGSFEGSIMDSGEEKVLIIGMDSEADTLDPMRFNGWVSYRVTRTIHESLVTEDLLSPEDQVPSIQPELAKEWDVSEDGMTYTFYLEEDVYFHDGTPFNADAVEFNVRRAWDESFEYFDPNSAANLTQVYGHVKGVRAIDEHSVEFTLNQPYSPFIRMLAIGGMGSTGIASPKAIRTYGNDGYAENPSGTGPFKYDARVMSERIEVVANDQYWREIPELDRVIFRPIPDDSARTMALQSGAVDLIFGPLPDSISRLEDQGFELVQSAPPHGWYLNFNFNNPDIQDVRVRQAIIKSINREEIAQDLMQGTATPATSMQTPGNTGYDPEFIDYEYDPQAARELLVEAGYDEGIEMVFQTSVDGSGQLIPVPIAERIQSDLAAIGITVYLDTSEWISYLATAFDPMDEAIGFNQMSWGFSTPYFLGMVGMTGAPANAGQYSNAQFDDVANRAVQETDDEKANKLWQEANQILADDAAFAPIINDSSPYLMAPYVEGFIAPNQMWFDLRQVSINNEKLEEVR